jgi:ankyrin repeat protein
LIAASFKGQIDIVEDLIKADANISIVTSQVSVLFVVLPIIYCMLIFVVLFRPQEGYTALMAASYKGHTAIVRLLLKGGADVSIKNKVWVTCVACI